MARVHRREFLIAGGSLALLPSVTAAQSNPSIPASIGAIISGLAARSRSSTLGERIKAVFQVVESSYVESPSHQAMLHGALKGLAGVVPEGTFEVTSGADQLSVGYTQGDGTPATLVLGSPVKFEDFLEDLRLAASLAQDLAPGLERERLLSSMFDGAVKGLDPHCSYLDAAAFQDLQVHGPRAGLGLEMRMEGDGVMVVSPIEGSPAFRAGIRPNDLIVKLDDTPVKGMTLNDAVKRMRGEPDTEVTLTIIREGESAPIVMTLTRAIIRVHTVKSRVIEPGYAWIRISAFQEVTAANLVKHLGALFDQGPLKGLVLDLRSDPGGLFFTAVAISAAFLPPQSLIASTDGRAEDARKKFYAAPEDYARRGADVLESLPPPAKTVPMVVLVNGGSAAGSEIVAGALQDQKRAKVLGTQTFGLGTIQTIFPLGSGTAVKITTARFLTPSNHSIQALGITPDIFVEDPNDRLPHVREADLIRHLPLPSAPAKYRPTDFGSPDDFQLAQAIAFLKGANKA